MGLFAPKISRAQMNQVQILMKQISESVNLINTTAKPDVFFGRLNFTLDCLLELAKYEKYKVFKSGTPSSDYRKIVSNIEATVNSFIERAVASNKAKVASLKTEKAKERNYAKFIVSMAVAFEASHTFWQGNGVYPHYTGPLFTESNHLKVKKMLAELDAELINAVKK